MGSMSIWHWLIVLVVVLLLFGRGRLSDIMGEFGKGVQSFKKGVADHDAPKTLAEPGTVTAVDPVVTTPRESETRQG